MKKASGGKRLVAYIIDVIIISLISLAFTRIASNIFPDSILIRGKINIGIFYSVSYITLIVNIIVFIIYYCVIPLFWEKQTFGRYLLNIKVIKESSDKMEFGDFLLRDFLGFHIIVGFLTGLCFLGIIINAVLVLGKDQTTIQDKLAKTVMIDASESVEVINKDEDDFNY